ncbi:DUF6615 family protein [Bradyrhizobium sp. BTAi1]|uniref:DUF6615 family protein n=1 Tax=Bradyrhizobium sp. (strain BTAi1 / ATCC BAA-1182) TaxID=288000 RepID=UPI00005DFCB1|nr:DUF6615 family protein [Bradyrhizobium sp. BTAi1]ABQ33473.1 hypothetical protein BBta_1233 [Bradyrhizobium sp. BTAi1]
MPFSDYPFSPEQMCLLNLARTSWVRRASAKRNNLSFGEESITETVLMDLADRFPGNVFILPFNKRREAQYGADWAWAFESADGSSVLPMLVQAKALDLFDFEYPEIRRRIGRTKTRQIDQLIDTATGWGWPAIYAFYNHLNDETRIPQNCGTLQLADLGTMPAAWGISIADAHSVRERLDDQTFDTHKQISMPLHCLLCSNGRGVRLAGGSPAMALAALRRLRPADRSAAAPLPPLFDQPLHELPPIFHLAKAAAEQRSTKRGSDPLRNLQKQFPSIAGVVIVRDAESEEG